MYFLLSPSPLEAYYIGFFSVKLCATMPVKQTELNSKGWTAVWILATYLYNNLKICICLYAEFTIIG